MNEDFIFGVILGGLVVGLVMSKTVRDGFKDLILGVINKFKGKE